MKKFRLYTDGAARGNPGPAGAGWAVLDPEGNCVLEGKKYLGETTNNQAEYQALVLALKEALKLGRKGLEVFADSELMIRQLKGEYKVKNEGLKPLHTEALLTLKQFQTYALHHVPREKNKTADRLANEAIDESLI